jgi:hypothetical protein
LLAYGIVELNRGSVDGVGKGRLLPCGSAQAHRSKGGRQ